MVDSNYIYGFVNYLKMESDEELNRLEDIEIIQAAHNDFKPGAELPQITTSDLGEHY